MSYPIVVRCIVAVEMLNLVLLWIALRARVSRMARPRIACCGVLGALGAFVWVTVIHRGDSVVIHGPVWMVLLTFSVLALSMVSMWVAVYLANHGDDGGGGEDPSLAPEPPEGGGDAEPLWWPEFERKWTAYATRRDRERQPVDC